MKVLLYNITQSHHQRDGSDVRIHTSKMCNLEALDISTVTASSDPKDDLVTDGLRGCPYCSRTVQNPRSAGGAAQLKRFHLYCQALVVGDFWCVWRWQSASNARCSRRDC